MARIGLRRFRFSKLDKDDNVTVPESLGKAIDCKVALELNSGELYGDDALCESDYSFNKGTVTITVDDDDDTILAPLLGHSISEEGEVVRKDTDVAPHIALGRILTKVVRGEYKYKVEYLSKVKFKETMPDEKTKGESVEFTTVSIEGSVMKKADGEWSKTKTFATFDEASVYLDKLLTKQSTNVEEQPQTVSTASTKSTKN